MLVKTAFTCLHAYPRSQDPAKYDVLIQNTGTSETVQFFIWWAVLVSGLDISVLNGFKHCYSLETLDIQLLHCSLSQIKKTPQALSCTAFCITILQCITNYSQGKCLQALTVTPHSVPSSLTVPGNPGPVDLPGGYHMDDIGLMGPVC